MGKNMQRQHCRNNQEELFEITNGSCSQIICLHDVLSEGEEEEDTVNEIVKGKKEEKMNEIVEAKPAKKRKVDDVKTQIHKKAKQDNVSSFPTIDEMNASREISLEKLPKDEVYEIMKAEKRTETFKRKNIVNCVHMVLRKEVDSITQAVRVSGLLYTKLFEEEKYEEKCKTHRFFFMYKGWNTSRDDNKYHDFIINTHKL